MPRPDFAFEPPKSNLPLLMIASGFLLVTVVLVLLQPSIDGQDEVAPIQQATVTPPAPQDAAAPDQQVSRAQTTLLNTPPTETGAPQVSARAIAEQLRQPIRLTGASQEHLDLPGLTRAVLAQFAPPESGSAVDDTLSTLVIESILQKQSDTYINVLLNTAAARGNVTIPPGLRTAAGDVDVRPLLMALVDAAGGETPAPLFKTEAGATHHITSQDSLAGLAMRHYGNPLNYTLLLEANPALDPAEPKLVEGTSITIP